MKSVRVLSILVLTSVLMSCKKDRNVVRFEVSSPGNGFDVAYSTQTEPLKTVISPDDYWVYITDAHSGEYVFLSAVSNGDPAISITLTVSIYFEDELIFTKDGVGYNQPVATVSGELP